MATIAELKNRDGSSVKLGALPPNPLVRGFTPNSAGNSSAPKLGAARLHPVGKITGRGTGTSDQVPINASNGEFIIKAAAVKKIGLEVLEALNAVADGPDEKDSKAEALAEYGDPESKSEDQGEGLESAEGMKCGGKIKGMAIGGLVEEPKKNSFGDAAAASLNPQVQVTPSKALNQPASPGLDAPPVNPTRGFTPLSQPNTSNIFPVKPSNIFGDAAASSLDARVSQIPATGGTFPAPAPDGKDNTETGRNIGNALSALPGASPALGAMRGFAGAAKAGGALDTASVGAGALAAKISPYVKPIAGVSALSMAAASGEPSAPSAQNGGATGTWEAPAMRSFSATPKPADLSTPAEPGSPTAVAQAAASPVAAPSPVGFTPSNQVTRVGNSYSGGPNIKGDIELSGTRGGMISAQDNQAAENLARAHGQTRGFGPAGAIRGGGQVSSMDTSAGYADDLKQLADIGIDKAKSEANMQAQGDYAANKVMEGRALAGNRGALQILNNNAKTKIEQRGQDIQSQGQQLTAGSAKYTADAHVKSQQSTNGIAERKLGIEEQRAATEQAQKAQMTKIDDAINNGNPIQQRIAAAKKAAMMGRGFNASGQAPSGYRETADGGLEFIKGGPADPNVKTGSGKPMPSSAAGGLLDNMANLRRAQTASSLLNGETVDGVVGDKNATGFKGLLPNNMLNRVDAAGVPTRAAVADLGSMVIHDRSGAAVTASEMPRLSPFIPSATDDEKTARSKTAMFVKNYQSIVDDTANFYRESGYKVPTEVLKVGGNPQQEPPAAREANNLPTQLPELQRRAAANPDLARRLKEAGY